MTLDRELTQTTPVSVLTGFLGSGKMVIHGVQHFFHPVVRLQGWQGERQSRLVFITYDLDPRVLTRSLQLANLCGQGSG